MLIPLQVEPAEEFLTRAAAAIAEQGTHIYVDTSLAMWLTKVGPESRAAFIDWSATVPDRIHVPAWTIQEYYRHHRAKTLKGDVDRQCEAVTKAASDFRSQLRILADGPLLPGEPEAAFLGKVDQIQEELRTLSAAAKGWDYQQASAEIIAWLNAHALSASTIFTRFGRLNETGGARYSHDVPPGYEDRHKGPNRYGDLLFWQDVISDARHRGAAQVIVMTRDRKEDWYGSAPEPDVGPALRRLKSRWEPVPSPHPMLAFEMRTRSDCDLILLDDLYLGAILWRADKARYGRFAAVALSMDSEKLSQELSPPPPIRVRATARQAADRISALRARDLISSALDPNPNAPAAAILAALEGDAPGAEGAAEQITPDWIGLQGAPQLAAFSRLVYELAQPAQPFATMAANRLLDAVDQMDAEHASAIVGGMSTAAFYDGAAPRNRPDGALLQKVYAWTADPGCDRVLKMLASRLRSVQASALVLPDATNTNLTVRLDAAAAVATVPPTLGQLFIGAQGLLTDQALGDEARLRELLGNRDEANAEEIVEAVGSYFGVPLRALVLPDAADEERWRIPEATGLERFGPRRQPTRGDVPPPGYEPPAAHRPPLAAGQEEQQKEEALEDEDDYDDDDTDDEGEEE